MTLFQLLTGSLPLRGDSMSALMHNIAHQTAPDVRTLRPELSDGLAHIVATALRKDPRERYQTGRQFAADLRNVENTHPQAVATAPEPQSLVYDARSNHQEHNMAAFQETVMDIPCCAGPCFCFRAGCAMTAVKLEYEFFARTDPGRVRANNEDAVAIDAQAQLALLADGMGGYNAGEVASSMATTFIRTEMGAGWPRQASISKPSICAAPSRSAWATPTRPFWVQPRPIRSMPAWGPPWWWAYSRAAA